MKEVIIYTEDRRFGSGEILVFSSEKKCLDYFRKIYPEKKSLRLRRSKYAWVKSLVLLNHNTPMLPWDSDFRIGQLDPSEQKTAT